MSNLETIGQELDYHEFKWWNEILTSYPEPIILEYVNKQKDLTKFIQRIQNEDIKIIEEIDKLLHKTLIKIKKEQDKAELESLAWSTLISNSGILRCDISSLKPKMSLQKKRDYLLDFIDIIKSCETGEIAMALVVATHFSQKFKLDTGMDLYLPYSCIETDSNFFSFLLETCSGSSIGQANTIIWVHTILATSDIKLRGLGREMWQEIGRGFPDVKHHEKLMSNAFNYKFNIDFYNQYPAGFSPIKNQNSEKGNLVNTEEKLIELLELHKKGLITNETLTEMQLKLLKDKF